MANVKEIENFLYNYAYDDIIRQTYVPGVRYTSENVWGARVCLLDDSNPEKLKEKWYRLQNYYATIDIRQYESDFEKIKSEIINKIREQTSKMLCGRNKFEDLSNLTCYQLADWKWLIDYKDGSIVRQHLKDGEYVYTATIAKYAIILDEYGDPIDPNIKEEL